MGGYLIIPLLIKRDSFGNILLWRINFEYSENGNKVRLKYTYGLYSGRKTTSYSDYIEPKNIGKRNQTTIEEQAKKEANSIFERQKKKGYKTIYEILKGTKEFEEDSVRVSNNVLNETYVGLNILDKYLPMYNTDANNASKPMKCQKFQIGKMSYPAICQPKINGVRCIIMYDTVTTGDGLFATTEEKVVIRSKEGIIYHIKHIEDEFLEFYKSGLTLLHPAVEGEFKVKNIIFDGELYIKNKPVTTIGGAARNINNEYHKDLKFVCFDLAIEDYNNEDRDNLRYKIFLERIKSYMPKHIEDHVRFINTPYSIINLTTHIVNSDEEVLEYRDRCIKEGYEGCVVRDMKAEYGFGQRPKWIMKCKTFDDSEFEILDIKCRGNAYDKVGFTIIYLLKNDINDLQFECNGMGTVEEKLNIYNHREEHIGKKATVKFYERTKNGLPFHANVVAIRDYE